MVNLNIEEVINYYSKLGIDICKVYDNGLGLQYYQFWLDDNDMLEVVGYDHVMVTIKVVDNSVIKVAYDSHAAYDTELSTELINLLEQ